MSPAASAVQMIVASNDFAVGTPRIPFVLYDGPQRVADAQTVRITAYDLTLDPPQPGWTGEATGYNDYAVPYWVVYPELPHAGFWGLQAEVTLAAGAIVQAQLTVPVEEVSTSPALGDPAPASQNRTLATEPDIHRLSSAAEPDPAFYQLTVAEALTTGKPTVVVFATPGFCQTELCVPVLDSAEAVHETANEQANFIHLEIYKGFNPLVHADEVEEWSLSSEPWIFVLDESGRVAARLGGPVSPEELTAALTPLLP